MVGGALEVDSVVLRPIFRALASVAPLPSACSQKYSSKCSRLGGSVALAGLGVEMLSLGAIPLVGVLLGDTRYEFGVIARVGIVTVGFAAAGVG
jgi:hypothetical protein